MGEKREELKLPWWKQYNFSVEVAAQYIRIGENKIRQMIAQTPYANWILRNGNRVQIKRILFEQFIDSLEAV